MRVQTNCSAVTLALSLIHISIKYSEPTKFKVVILGDVNLDGNVSIQDATLVSKHIEMCIRDRVRSPKITTGED